MAKPKRSSADIDAELAALEAQLATLGQKSRKAAPPPAPAATSAAPAARAAPPAAPEPAYDAALWREEDGAWVRAVKHEPIVVRRVLDEQGNVVREEDATQRDLEEETPVRAERGIGKLFRRKGR